MAHLNRYLVPFKESECAEICTKIPVDFNTNPKEFPDIARLLTGLLNGIGGILTLENIVTTDPLSLDTWKKSFTDLLLQYLPLDIFQAHIDIVDIGQPLQCMHIVVKPSPTLITIKYHATTRLGPQTVSEVDIRSLSTIMSMRDQPTSILNLQESYTYGETFPFQEDSNIEFKCWSVNFATLIKRLKDKRFVKVLLAMPNLPTGGDIVLGVKEDEKSKKIIVRGQEIDDIQEGVFIQELENLLLTDCDSNEKRIWEKPEIEPQKDVDWSVSFHKVTATPHNKRRKLIQIHLNHKPGGVFHQYPEAYNMTDSYFFQQMPFQEWKAAVLLSVQLIKPEDKIPRTSADSSTGHATVSPRTTPSIDVDSDEDNSTTVSPGQIDEVLARKRSLTWSKHRKNWTKDLGATKYRVSDHVRDIRKEGGVLLFTQPLTYTPAKHIILQHEPNIAHILEHIEDTHSDQKGFVIASKHWLTNIHEDDKYRPPHHVMDLLSVGTPSNGLLLYIWTVTSTSGNSVNREQQWEYVVRAALKIKQKFKETRHMAVTVICKLCPLDGTVHCGRMEYLTQCRTHDSDMTLIVPGLAELLYTHNLSIKNTIGDEILINVTRKQIESVTGTDIPDINMIEGPPGSGKTVLALYIATLFGMMSTLYVCTTTALRANIDYQGKCMTYLAQSKADFLYLREASKEKLQDIKCIIFDDLHHLDVPIKLIHIVFETLVRDSKRQIFVFLDSKVQNYKRAYKMACLQEKLTRFCFEKQISFHYKTLSEVHRNTRKVVSFMKAADVTNSRINCVHDLDGDDVELVKVNNLTSRDHSNDVVLYIEALLEQSVNDLPRYDTRDIAVLVDSVNTEKDIITYMNALECILPKSQVHRSHVFPRRGVVIDKLDNFMGLDAKVCIFVISDYSTWVRRKNSLTNPRYRLFIASRGIFKVVFLIKRNLDSSIAELMGFNDLPVMDNPTSDVDDQYQYDCYVACFNKDMQFVESVLVKEMEGCYGMQLCIADRDWKPGETIYEEIIRSIQASRSTLIVLTSDFVNSSWCDFELQMSLQRDIEEGINRTIIIDMGIPSKNLRPTLKAMKRNKYWIVWKGMEEKKRFASKLAKTIHSISKASPKDFGR